MIKDFEKLDPQKLPKHVAIIMDGNGRWAKKRGLPRIEGHKIGAKSVEDVVETSRKIGIKYLTLYSFSKDNWKRPKEEVEGLMQLLKEYLIKERTKMKDNGIKFDVIGNIEDLPQEIIKEIEITKEFTSDCKDMHLYLALSYSGREEIIKIVRKSIQMFKEGKIVNETQITQDLVGDMMKLPDVDLLIRTSGEIRISDFLLWQIAYAELYFTKKLWPDFRGKDLIKAILWFQKRERRFGLTPEQIPT